MEPAIRSVPPRIFLQVGEDAGMPGIEQMEFNDLGEVTWSQDRIFDSDIEYVLVESSVVPLREVNDGQADPQ